MNENTPGKEEPPVEPTTALTAAKVANAAFEDSRSLFKRVLGPPADSMGRFFAEWLDIKTRNAIRIAKKADEKRAQSQDNSDGAVPMRVAMRIFDEGAYCDDDSEIVVEYLGGILASARRAGPKNDVANSYAAVVSRMASDHLFMHYILYKANHAAYAGRQTNTRLSDDLAKRNCFIPYGTLIAAVHGSSQAERFFIEPTENMFWLQKEGLIDNWRTGPQAGEGNGVPATNPGGIVFQPTTFGIALFLWGLGRPNDIPNFYNINEEELRIEGIRVPHQDVIALSPPLA